MTFPGELRSVVTGAAGGLGRALAVELGRRGGRVLCADLDLAGAEETARQVREAGGTGHPVQCDVRAADQMQHLRDRAHAEMGGVDLLANNAGVAAGGPFDEIPLDDWRWVVDVNLFGVILGCRTFVPEFKRQGHGYILNVGSVAGLLSVPNLAPYSVTKYGVVALSEALYAELRDFGVHVTVLCPSFFRTGIIERSRGTDESTREVAARLMERSKIQAPEVAARALTALERGQLYALPMEHGKWVWRAKRAAPVLFYRALARSRRRLEQYFGRP